MIASDTMKLPSRSIPFLSSPIIASSVFIASVGLFFGLSTQPLLAQAAAPAADVSHHAEAQNQLLANWMQELDRTRTPSQSEMSPDGKIVAWVAPSGSSGNRIELRLLNGSAASTQEISMPGSNAESARNCSQGDVAWSPDSKQIAFASDCATPGQQQVFSTNVTLDSSGALAAPSTPRELTAVKGFIHNVTWSPDGKHLSFLFVENATRPPDALHAIKPLIGVISAHTIAEVQRVAVIDSTAANATMPQLTQVTPASLHVYEFDWSPDSKRLAYIAAAPPGEDNWWVAQLYTQALPDGTPHSILQPKMQIAVPRWSPDGKQIAFIGGLMSDFGETGGDVYLVSAAGGPARDVTAGRKASAAWPHWLDSHRLGFTEVVDGESRFSVVNPATGVEDKSARVTFPATIGDGVRQLSLSFAKNPGAVPTAALIESSFDRRRRSGPARSIT